jgi:multisubunit Na+/H+ antiporter MnhG subunit
VSLVVWLFLGVAVAGAALGCAGLLRLPKVADRLHLLGFVSVVGGFGLLPWQARG